MIHLKDNTRNGSHELDEQNDEVACAQYKLKMG